MSTNTNFHDLSLAELQEQCAQETINYWRGLEKDAWHCYEVFRRAIVKKSEDAWEIILEQYGRQVERWVQQHPKFRDFRETPDDFVSLVFEKFWKRDFSAQDFSRFPDVKSLLAYLKTCVASVITDYWRVYQRSEIFYLEDISPQSQILSHHDKVENRLEEEDFWNSLRLQLEDEVAFQVVHSSFVLNLKPTEIYSLAPDVFGSIQEVYRIKAKAISQLGRLI